MSKAHEQSANDGADEARDKHLNSHRVARSAALKSLVQSVIGEAEAHESAQGLRQRRRKPDDQRSFERQVECLVCEALLRDLEEPRGWVTVTRSKRVLGYESRYQSEVMGKGLPKAMDLLESQEMGLLEVSMGIVNPFNGRNVQTTFRATEKLLERAAPLWLTTADFGRSDDEEVIILKAPKKGSKSAERIPYEDTAETRRMRRQMHVINGWLAKADIELTKDIAGACVHDRKLTRSFNNGTFSEGGRLSGGFWQQHMTKAQRSNILIDDCETVTLDYKQMGPTIHYGLAGLRLGMDAYAVPGYEFHRQGIKKVFGAMTQARSRFNRLDDLDMRLLPGGVTVSKVCRDIEAYHAPIASRFYCASGMEAMRTESNILVDVLMELRRLGIAALPIHDAVRVREDQAETVAETMREVFHRHTGNSVDIGDE